MSHTAMSPEAIQDQRSLLTAHRQRLAILLWQLAQHGAPSAPPVIFTDISAARAEIRRIKDVLRRYNAGVIDEPIDEDPIEWAKGAVSASNNQPDKPTYYAKVGNQQLQPKNTTSENDAPDTLSTRAGQVFPYDVYISYVPQEPDETWVWETLVPRLQTGGVRMVVADEPHALGVDRVINSSHAIEQAKRTLLVLSDAYVKDGWGRFERVIADTIGIEEGTYRLLPVLITPIEPQCLPLHLRRLVRVDLSRPRFIDRGFANLIQALLLPLPFV